MKHVKKEVKQMKILSSGILNPGDSPNIKVKLCVTEEGPGGGFIPPYCPKRN